MNKLEEFLLKSTSTDRDVRCTARRRLQSLLSDAKNEEHLIDLPTVGDDRIRRSVAAAAGLVSNDSTFHRLVAAALDDSDSNVLAEICWTLEDTHQVGEEYWAQISRLFGHADWHVRQAAIYAASACQDIDGEKLSDLVIHASDPVWQVRYQPPMLRNVGAGARG